MLLSKKKNSYHQHCQHHPVYKNMCESVQDVMLHTDVMDNVKVIVVVGGKHINNSLIREYAERNVEKQNQCTHFN